MFSQRDKALELDGQELIFELSDMVICLIPELFYLSADFRWVRVELYVHIGVWLSLSLIIEFWKLLEDNRVDDRFCSTFPDEFLRLVDVEVGGREGFLNLAERADNFKDLCPLNKIILELND